MLHSRLLLVRGPLSRPSHDHRHHTTTSTSTAIDTRRQRLAHRTHPPGHITAPRQKGKTVPPLSRFAALLYPCFPVTLQHSNNAPASATAATLTHPTTRRTTSRQPALAHQLAISPAGSHDRDQAQALALAKIPAATIRDRSPSTGHHC